MRRLAPSKDEIATLLPFEGLTIDRVRVPATVEQFAAAGAVIKAAGVVGFDTESKPTFKVGEVSDGPHIAQFATPTEAFIFQVQRAEGLPFLLDILQSDDVRKVGFGLSSDLKHIRGRFGVELRAVVDLNDVFRREGFRSSTGVRAAIALLFDRRFLKSKRQTTSNWALPHLDDKQLLYAANDAYAALRVHQEMDGYFAAFARADDVPQAADPTALSPPPVRRAISGHTARSPMFLGLRTAIYPVDDLAEAKRWYALAFEVEPYFDQPFYVGFKVGGFELGLIPDGQPSVTGPQPLWGVTSIARTWEHLIRIGAHALDPVTEVGEGIRVGAVRDPFGNRIGLIENAQFDRTAVR